MAQVRRALEFTLRQQEPYPALVVDGRWNILMSNEGSSRLMGLFLDPAEAAALGPPNALRLFYHPRGMRPFIVNWQATAGALIQWLHRDMLRGHPETARLLDELLSYPDVPKAWRTLDLDAPAAPFLAVELAKDDLHLTFFSTLTSLGVPTPIQAEGWPVIASGQDVLLTAPTGSGKTLAAFLHCLDALVRQAASGALEDATEVVYVSPLRALSNDIRRNLEEPLGELRAVATEIGAGALDIRTAVRTGDTSAAGRQAPAARARHHPRVALHPVDVRIRAARAVQRAHGDRRRNPRHRARQARRSSRPFSRAPRRAGDGGERTAAPADRALRHRETGGGGGPPPRRLRASPARDRQRGAAK